jgi:hypothetical protein
MKSESMIGGDGSLTIRLRGQDVTWFQFLQTARLTNSNHGGWNSKTHWHGRGLKVLTPELVDLWTKNSLAENALPTPREAKFKLQRQPTTQRSNAAISGRDKMGKEQGITENELNAALYSMKWPVAWGKRVSYEVPMAAESDGQLKIDLLGYGEDEMQHKRFISIIELKRANNKSDSPLMALTEAICYAIQLARCKNKWKDEFKDFDKEFDLDDCRTIRLVLAAPGKYWKYWNSREHVSYVEAMQGIVNRLIGPLSHNIRLEIHSVACQNGSVVTEPVTFD